MVWASLSQQQGTSFKGEIGFDQGFPHGSGLKNPHAMQETQETRV